MDESLLFADKRDITTAVPQRIEDGVRLQAIDIRNYLHLPIDRADCRRERLARRLLLSTPFSNAPTGSSERSKAVSESNHLSERRRDKTKRI
ncbi:hypothetical protein KIN20_007444 [Parelaphostrongylus tenuis]|uniref:Uncharacterized protein n=1 Tax=Parelaphostrongylus tenuis TaxID=148309 RepID=A0AAD5M6K7_PARTN|nr:hypothetical protein KIN20_007444 [Parelaphostrongylus tenuis]